MYRIALFLLAGLFLLGTPLQSGTLPISSAKEIRQDVTVYITKTGAKYHRSNCRYLSQSKISIGKKQAAAKGYGACKVCKP